MLLKRWKVWLPLGLFVTFLIVAGQQLTQPNQEEVVSAMIGNPLPEFALKPSIDTLPGVTTADFRDGKPRLLNVFASWCVPCIAEAPQLGQLQQRGAEIVGIALRDRPEDVAEFLAENGNPYSRIGADDISEVQLGIGSSGVPETFVIDGSGTIRYQHIGDIRPEHVDLLLAKLREAGA